MAGEVDRRDGRREVAVEKTTQLLRVEPVLSEAEDRTPGQRVVDQLAGHLASRHVLLIHQEVELTDRAPSFTVLIRAEDLATFNPFQIAEQQTELALQLNRGFLQEEGIEAIVSGDDFQVRCRPASLVQVLDNLVHNSCYWTGTLPKHSIRRVGAVLDRDVRRVLVIDSGPGTHDEARQHMFDPFFTMKAGGKASLDIRQNKEGRIEVPNLTKEEVHSIDEVMAFRL